ncbi:MAG: DUF5683 domain-containing protein [Bacteroidota bacterium]
MERLRPVIVLLLVFASGLAAQEPGALRADTSAPAPVETPLCEAAKSPGLALLFSGLLPGAGQLYNESYLKVPVIAGCTAYFVSRWLYYDRLAEEARARYAASLLAIPSGDGLQVRLREYYKEQRDTYTWYLVILYAVNLADAFVDASLYDFDVGENLSLALLPAAPSGLRVQVSF